MDSFFLTALTVWGSMVVFDKEVRECTKGESDNYMLRWWTLCLLSMIFGWLYSFLLLLAIPPMCIMLIVTCYYNRVFNSLRREHDQNDSSVRIPFAENLIKALGNQKFDKTKRAADTCVICMD